MNLRLSRVNENLTTAPRTELCGFTLVEMLVIIAILGILAGLLLPSLSRAKQKSKSVNCISNLGQMQVAWSLYADESQSSLVPNRGFRHVTTNNYYQNWAAGDVSSIPDETNALLLANSLLGPYTKNVAIYRCPSDPGNPMGISRVRSFSMNNYMNGTGIDIFSNNFAYSTKESQISNPSGMFVFLDERSSTINDCYFAVELTTNYYSLKVRDMPANYHLWAAGFSFADGHAEIKRWRTALFQNPSISSQNTLVSAPQNEDALWLMQHASTPISGPWP